jgi:hypothetical protein
MINHFLDGNLQLSELWAQHNEHRPLIFRIARLFFVWTTNWNLVYEMYFSLVLTILIFVTLLWLVRFTHRPFELKSYAWLLIFIALLNWSPTQFENFLWAMMMCFFFQNIFALLSIIILTTGTHGAWKVILAAILAALSSYSSGAGLFLWPIGLIVLLAIPANSFDSRDVKWKNVFLWLFFAAFIIGIYFWNYQKPDYHPDLWYALRHPLHLVAYISGYIGSVFCVAYIGSDFVFREGLLGSIIGIAGISAWLLGTVFWYYKSKGEKDLFRRGLPWFAIGNYALLTAFIIGMSRVGFSKGQGLTSRYVTNSILFWVALAALGNIVRLKYYCSQNLKPISSKFRLRLKTCLILLSFALLLRSGHVSLANWRAEYQIRETAKTALINGDLNNPVVSQIVPEYVELPPTLDFLKRNRLSPFQND